MKTSKKFVPALALLALVSLPFSGCESSGDNALLGAATGAVIGGSLHGRGDQALAGAAIGAAGGYLIGRAVREDRHRAYDRGYADAHGDREVRRDSRDYEVERYPLARPTARYGFVISPYRPYNRIDVRGIPSGAQVVDPSTDRVFINP